MASRSTITRAALAALLAAAFLAGCQSTAPTAKDDSATKQQPTASPSGY